MKQSPPSAQSGYGPDALGTAQVNDAHMEGNPYYQQNAPTPDLDANAPFLKSGEQQRMNRKALLFLAGIVGFLVLMVFWLLKTATSDEVSKPRPETVIIPELPRDTDTAETAQDVSRSADAAEPIALADSSPQQLPPLPPLPPADISQSAHSSDPGSSLQPHEPTLLERRMGNAVASGRSAQPGTDPYLQAMLAALPGNQANAPQIHAQSGSTRADASSAQFINNPDALLVRGTYIRCILETRIITDIPGFTSCVVTDPVYSINGRRLLLPKGSKMVGQYHSNDPRVPRVAVIWNRITTPNGIDVTMASPGVDNLGGAGHPGHYDAHWLSRMSAALMISLVSDAFQYAGAKHGPEASAISNGVVVQSPYDSGTARTMERLANEALDRSMSRPATVTIDQGTVINVYVAKDVDFSGVLSRS